MATGDKILAQDYNTVQTKIANLLGTGSGTSGYGQTVQSSQVAVGEIITDDQFDLLRFDIINVIKHQTGLTPVITNVDVGDIIRFGATQPNTQYESIADTAIVNKFDLGTGEFVTLTEEAIQSRNFTSPWTTEISCILTVEFANATEARFFWNSGGKLRFSTERSGVSNSAQESQWTTFLDTIGFVFIDAAESQPNAVRGVYDLTNSFQTMYEDNASSPYAANKWRIRGRTNVSNNSGATASTYEFEIAWIDSYRDPTQGRPGNPLPNDEVTGEFSVTIDEILPDGVLQPAPATGNFTVSSPTSYSITSITGS